VFIVAEMEDRYHALFASANNIYLQIWVLIKVVDQRRYDDGKVFAEVGREGNGF
jgi:hypothetical protein